MAVVQPPYAHRPYDGSTRPFTVGLTPISEPEWLEPDANLVPHLRRKDELLAIDRAAVVRTEDGTEDAQDEVLQLVLQALRGMHGGCYQVGQEEVIIDGQVSVPLAGADPMVTAARLIQEDLVLMRPAPGGYRLVAACLCFPSSWSLAEKFGQSMPEIHENVPGFNGSRMGNVVARLFDNLRVGQLVCRYNWSIYDDANLHHPKPKQIAPQVSADGESLVGRLFLRVERQTLRRLAGSGDILFTIKIHHDPLSLLRSQPDRAGIAAGLKQQLLALEPAQLIYKGLTQHQQALAAELDRLSDLET
ncbi:heme-dependent oxidative N-demethylase family protein [Roseibium aquae]|nr:DUF3445 domain-containing protein [Roseibium aquae]